MSQRRSFGGPRREASERVVIRAADPRATAGLAGSGVANSEGPGGSSGHRSSDADGGAETEESLRKASDVAEAWTLNVSRGGCRVVLETPVTVGADYEVQVGEAAFRPARVVWVRDEADGQIAGLQFLDVESGEVPTSSYPPTS